MKKMMMTAALALSALPALAADVGVSISIGQPGFYGHIDIGDYYPRPRLIYPQPVVIVSGPHLPPPVYMHVPPGHAKNWRKHCGRYEACGRPVYFVQDSWYNDVYVPRYRERHAYREVRHDHHDGRQHYDKHDRDDHRRGGYDDHRGGKHDKGGRGHGGGPGNGNGNGNGRGRD